MSARRDAALTAAIVATKAATIGFAVDAFLNADSPRLRGKAIRTRAIGYVGALFIVPVAWRLLPERDGYPRVLDLAVTVPLLLDAGGNAFGLYERAYIDDVVHLTNSAIVSAVAGELLAPHVRDRRLAALAGASVSIAAETGWEIMEYVAMRLGANGMGLTYEDTMADLIEGVAGAAIGAFVTVARSPRDRSARPPARPAERVRAASPASRLTSMADRLRLTYVGHATLLIELDGLRILTDPVLGARVGPLRRLGPAPDPGALGPIDTVLISHAHPDHFDRASLGRLAGDPLLVVPRGLGPAAAVTGRPVREVAANERLDLGGVRIRALPARHGRWPLRPAARPIGYLIEGSSERVLRRRHRALPGDGAAGRARRCRAAAGRSLGSAARSRAARSRHRGRCRPVGRGADGDPHPLGHAPRAGLRGGTMGLGLGRCRRGLRPRSPGPCRTARRPRPPPGRIDRPRAGLRDDCKRDTRSRGE